MSPRMMVIRSLQWLMSKTPFEIRNRKRILPPNTLHALNLVLAYYRSRGEMVTVMQVGACDGSSGDPLNQSISSGGARAILVEPNPMAFGLLQKTYTGLPNVTLVQAAVAEKEGEASLYRVREGAFEGRQLFPELGMSSFDRMHLTRGGIKPEDIESVTVSCRTLSGLVADQGLSHIDLLLIDVEGFDAEIVRMALDMPVRPTCIECEHSHLSVEARAAMFARLEAEGYLVACDTWNMFAMQGSVLDAWKAGKK